MRQSERADRYAEAAARALENGAVRDDDGSIRLDGITLVRPDGTATYQLASVADDLALGHHSHHPRLGSPARTRRCSRESHTPSGASCPEVIHHGLLLGADGKKLSKRHGHSVGRRAAGGGGARGGSPRVPPRAWPSRARRVARRGPTRPARDRRDRGDVRTRRWRRSATRPSGWHVRFGARARLSRCVRSPSRCSSPCSVALGEEARPTLERLVGAPRAERRRGRRGRRARALRELKAVGGDLKTVRRALTGAERGPELWTVLAYLSGPRGAAAQPAAPRRGRRNRLGSVPSLGCGSTTRLRVQLVELPPPPTEIGMYVCGPTVYQRRPHRERPAVRGVLLDGPLAPGQRPRGEARPQHHRRQRQDLRRGSRGKRAARRRGIGVVSRRCRAVRARRGRRVSEGDRDDGRDHRADRRPRRAGITPIAVDGDVYFRVASFPGYGAAFRAAPRSDGGLRAEPAQGRPARLRALEGEQAGRGHRLGLTLGSRSSRLAHRVLGDGGARARARVLDPRRRARHRVPAPRERACAVAQRRPSVREDLGPQRDASLHRREDVEVARQRRDDPRRPRPLGHRDGARCSSSPPTGASHSTSRTRRWRRRQRRPRRCGTPCAASSAPRATGSGLRRRSRTTSTRRRRSRCFTTSPVRARSTSSGAGSRSSVSAGCRRRGRRARRGDEGSPSSGSRREPRGTTRRPTPQGRDPRRRVGSSATPQARSSSCRRRDQRSRLRPQSGARGASRTACGARALGRRAGGGDARVARRGARGRR